MADAKITALSADTSPTTDDLVVTVNDPAGTPANKKVTIGAVKGLGRAYQTDNSNSISSTTAPTGLIVQYGWGQFLGNGTGNVTESVTFPTAFTTVLGVVGSGLGAKATSAASDITGLTTALAATITLTAESVTTSGFNASISRSSATFANTFYYGYSWIAWGI